MAAALSVFSFDFLSTDCYTKNHLNAVIVWSVVPIFIVLVNGFVFAVRHCLDESRHAELVRFHMYAFLLVSYLVTPPVTFQQFQALKCTEVCFCGNIQKKPPPISYSHARLILCSRTFRLWSVMNKVAGASYLEFDTSVDCSSTEYKHFVILDLIFIAAYMTVPLIWLILLWRKRDRMNPWLSNRKYSLHIRNADAGLAPYSKFGSDTARAVFP